MSRYVPRKLISHVPRLTIPTFKRRIKGRKLPRRSPFFLFSLSFRFPEYDSTDSVLISLTQSFLFRSLSQIITYDPTRSGVSVVTEKGDITRSFLLVQEAKPSDSGRYTCNPSNAQPKSITVHVLNGE